MKIYMSADIEGITGVSHWDETDIAHAEYAAARQIDAMTICLDTDDYFEVLCFMSFTVWA